VNNTMDIVFAVSLIKFKMSREMFWVLTDEKNSTTKALHAASFNKLLMISNDIIALSMTTHKFHWHRGNFTQNLLDPIYFERDNSAKTILWVNIRVPFNNLKQKKMGGWLNLNSYLRRVIGSAETNFACDKTLDFSKEPELAPQQKKTEPCPHWNDGLRNKSCTNMQNRAGIRIIKYNSEYLHYI
jgi:hypothetical protein